MCCLTLFQIPQRYRFSSKSQQIKRGVQRLTVVLDTTKVQIFKQITTSTHIYRILIVLFQIPQRYRFSSKSQLTLISIYNVRVVLDTTKVQIFKQITTTDVRLDDTYCCFRYHKGTDFQANHNEFRLVKRWYLLFQIPQRYRFSSKSQQ